MVKIVGPHHDSVGVEVHSGYFLVGKRIVGSVGFGDSLKLVVAFLQNNVTVVELLANDENSNFICQWSVKSSWMFHGWSFVWSNNYAVLW